MERLVFDGGAAHNPVELGIHLARYGVVADLCRGRRVLDVACGAGFGSYLMAARWGAASVHALDVSAEALAQARALFDRPEITWVEMDADRLDAAKLDAPFDLIVSFETIEHLLDPAAFLTSLKTLLAPGGTLVVSCPNDHWYYGAGRSKNVWHRHTYTFEEFRALAEGVLGPATRYLVGSTAGAFANTPLADGARQPETLVEGLGRVSPSGALAIPGTGAEAPSVEASLYWIGSWGPAAAEASVTYTPLSPDHRFAVDHLRPTFVFQQRARPRIVLVADVRGWAFDNIAQHIRTHLGDVFEVVVLYIAEFPDHVECLRKVVVDLHPELVHFFWRESLFDILSTDAGRAVCERYGIAEERFMERFASIVVTTSVYDHLFADAESIEARSPFLWFVDGYSVSSERLRAIYGAGGPPPPDIVIEDGVDTDLFRPLPGTRRDDPERELVVGWAGNSNWNRTETRDPKGLHSLLKPALERLRAEGVRVTGRFMDSAERTVPRSKMPEFYNAIDVYVCVSEIEGTPNPVLEAMACGVPIVSTDVGIVPQVLGAEQHRFILPERTVDTLVAALRTLLADAGLRGRLGEENLVRIAAWSWAHQMPKWLQLFKIAAARVDERNARRRRTVFAFAAAAVARYEGILRQKDAVIAATEDLVQQRWDIMEHMGRQIAARDEAIETQRTQVDRLESDLRSARSLGGTLTGLLGNLHARGVDAAALVAVVWPLLLCIANPSWVFTNPYVLPWFDPFVFLGYFQHFPEYLRASPTYYPGERLPWILPGYALYHLMGAVEANYVLHLGVAGVALLALYATVQELFDRRTAILTALCMGAYPGFLMAAGSDWVDGPAIAYALVAIYFLTRAARRPRWRLLLALAGAATAALIFSLPVTAVLVPGLAVHHLLVRRDVGCPPLPATAGWFGAGLLACTAALGAANVAAGGSFLFFQSQLRGAAGVVSSAQPLAPPASWNWLLAFAAWSSLPLLVLLGVLVHLGVGRPWAAEPAADDEVRRARLAVSLQYAWMGLAFVALEGTVHAVLSLPFYASLLIPGMMLVLGAFLSDVLAGLRRTEVTITLMGAAMILALVLVPAVGAPLQSMLGIAGGHTPVLLPAAFALAGLLALRLLGRKPAGVLAFVLGLGLANVAVATHPQLSLSFTRDRTDGFGAIVKAVRTFQALNPDGRLGLWIDTDEQPLGPNVLWATWIATHVRLGPFRSLDSPPKTFARMNPATVQPGDRIAVLSGRPAAVAEARAALTAHGFAAREVERRTIRRGDIRLFLVVLQVEPPGRRARARGRDLG